MGRPRGALTTGQAARLCFVTSDTIVNWIKAGHLPAQRTAGGQYRIRVHDLRAFMESRDMSTEPLDDAAERRTPCWEFHAGRGGSRSPEACRQCIVRFLGVLDCFKLMGLRPPGERTPRGCDQCAYFRRWGARSEERAERQD